MAGHDALERALGYRFRDASLLEQALTHRSYSAHHNERLEFLGDSVLNFVVAAILYRKFGKVDEGDLSRARSSLVKQSALAEIAQRLALSQHLRLGEGELKSGGFRRPSILADAMEAIFGAIFLDAGFEAVQKVIAGQVAPMLVGLDPRTVGKDAKTLLQEELQGHKYDLPTYRVLATHGAAHSQMFEVECAIPALEIAVSAPGSSRRAAEQSAAALALDAFRATLPAKGRQRVKAHKPHQSHQLSLPVAVMQEAK